MAYKRRTKDVWEIQVRYGPEYGYECVTTEDTLVEAMEQLKCYQENEPQYPSRIVKKRVRIDRS